MDAGPMRMTVQQRRGARRRAAPCATLSALTSVMAYSTAAVCAWLPARAAPARARRCVTESARKWRCQSPSRTVARKR